MVAVQWANLRDPDVNKRFGGMHNFAAEALQNTKVVPYSAEWPQIMEALETAMSEAASGTKSVNDAFKGAEATVRRIVRRGVGADLSSFSLAGEADHRVSEGPMRGIARRVFSP